jgi:DNA polymerase-3 subunit alpha
MKPKFIEQAAEKGHDPIILEKIWKDWEAFASYAFNKSHSTCYAWIAYQTAYLKAHYPAEYMAAVLSNNMNDIKQVSFFMEECKRMGLAVLGPDVNESFYKFTVNENYAVRFGMGAVKGVGAGAVQTIVERRKDGNYKSIFDLAKRIDLRAANKKAFENLALAGGFDGFVETHRAQYFHHDGDGITFLEKAIRYGSKFQENENSSQVSLFGDASEVQIAEPVVPPCDDWSTMEKLAKEKEVVGIFISGHPLDEFKVEIESFCKGTVAVLNDVKPYLGQNLTIAAVVSGSEHRFTKKGDPFSTLTLEDYTDSSRLFLFSENHLRFKHFAEPGTFVVITGRVEIPRHRQEPEFVIGSIELLQELRDKKAKAVNIRISNTDLTFLLIEAINEVINENIGNVNLKFVIYDSIEGIEIEMPSRSIKVKPSNDLFKKLAKLGVEFSLN